jgi:hypothetical protein
MLKHGPDTACGGQRPSAGVNHEAFVTTGDNHKRIAAMEEKMKNSHDPQRAVQ